MFHFLVPLCGQAGKNRQEGQKQCVRCQSSCLILTRFYMLPSDASALPGLLL
jgi:hypothetical protein